MKYRKILLLLALCLGLASAAGAQETRKVLLFPIVIQGDYQPRSAQDFTQALLNQAHKMAPRSTVMVARPADLAGLQVEGSGRPPSLSDTARLCAAYGATHAVWLSLRFSPELTQGTPAILTVGVGARMWGYNAQAQKVVLDEPVAVARSSNANNPTDQQLKILADKLSGQCINQLAQQVVAMGRQHANQNLVAQWSKQPASASAPQVGAPPLSANYKNMVSALQRYQRAMDGGNLIDSTDSQRQALSAWRSLTAAEQQQIESQYPGTYQWMNGGVYCDTGNPWSPGYFRAATSGGPRRR